jgi:hypothetical protein
VVDQVGAGRDRTAEMKANGDMKPVWPPAPAHTQASPSTPAATAFWASLRLTTSAMTVPP